MNFFKKVAVFGFGYYSTIFIKLFIQLKIQKKDLTDDIFYIVDDKNYYLYGVIGGMLTYCSIYGRPRLL